MRGGDFETKGLRDQEKGGRQQEENDISEKGIPLDTIEL